MSTAPDPEFVVYRGRRALGVDLAQLWPRDRRERYLLRKDAPLPVSLDRSVLPEATNQTSNVVDVIATVVPTQDSSEAVLRWRGSQTYDEVPVSPQWQRLGYDVCDDVGTSGLMNCSYQPGDWQLVADFAAQVNDHHLFRTATEADAFRAICDRRVSEHKPFAVIAVYVRASQISSLK